jgi:hypothetical protein
VLDALEELLELLELADVPPVVTLLDEELDEEDKDDEDEDDDEDDAPTPLGVTSSPESELVPAPPHALSSAAPAEVPARRKKWRRRPSGGAVLCGSFPLSGCVVPCWFCSSSSMTCFPSDTPAL